MRRIALLVLGSWSIAASAQSSDALRRQFEAAYLAARPMETATDDASLRNYLLYPYLVQRRLSLALTSAGDDALDRAVAEFLDAQRNEPVARDLRRQWYANLAQREAWAKYLEHYRDVDDKALRCHEFTARIKLERTNDLATQVAQLWSTTPDSLPACETPFNWLRTQSSWTPTLIERRARLALTAGNPAFARQLIAMLPPELAAPLQTWATLIEQPRRAIEIAIQTPAQPIESVALMDGWIRYVRATPETAAPSFAALVRVRKLDEITASRMALELALALSWNRRAEALDYFAKVRPQDFDERGFEWRARAAMWQGRWKLLSTIIGSMPDGLRQQTRWRYWLARATAAQGDVDSARKQYASLLGDDNYYAALGAARIKARYTPAQRALEVDELQVQALARQASFARAREMRLTAIPELREAAYDEWRFGYNKLDAAARVQAVALASQWQWHDQAILIAAEQKLFNDYRMLYPHAYDSEVAEAAELTGLPRPIIYATLRQESLFRTDAQSLAGALGLMQLIPETARRTARKWKLPRPDNLFDPRTNILVGAAHLKDIVVKYNGHLAVGLAAYNAGPNAAARWLPADRKDIDVWIENIPYNETRTYVQRILWHSVVFGWLAEGAPQDVSGWLTTLSP